MAEISTHGGTCDNATYLGLHFWYEHIMKKYGWIVLSSQCNDLHQILKKVYYASEVDSFISHCDKYINLINNKLTNDDNDRLREINILKKKMELFKEKEINAFLNINLNQLMQQLKDLMNGSNLLNQIKWDNLNTDTISNNNIPICNLMDYNKLNHCFVKIIEKYGWIIMAYICSSNNSEYESYLKYKIKFYIHEIYNFILHCEKASTRYSSISRTTDILIILNKIKSFCNIISSKLKNICDEVILELKKQPLQLQESRENVDLNYQSNSKYLKKNKN